FSPRSRSPPHLLDLSLHDALPILPRRIGFAQHLVVKRDFGGVLVMAVILGRNRGRQYLLHIEGRVKGIAGLGFGRELRPLRGPRDRKSTRLNSSHLVNSYAVFCLK